MEPGQKPSIDITRLILSCLLLFITLAVFYFYHKRKTSRRGVLLTGLSNSGKTLIFSQLVHGKYVDTHTSIKENSGELLLNNAGLLKVIDIPGYDRLRDKFLDKYKSSARVILYVIDSVTLQHDIRDSAEFLYNILSDPEVASNVSSLLVVCNKQDLPSAKSSTVVKDLLQKELNTLKVTKSSQLESVDPKARKSAILGREGKEFEFADVKGVSVDFVEFSAGTKEGDTKVDTELLQKWLSKVI